MRLTRAPLRAARPVPRRVAARRPVAVAASADLVPALDGLLRQFVCPAAVECAGLVVPGDPPTQQRVVDTFIDFAHAFDLSHGQGYVLRALLAGDMWTARELAMGFDVYNAGLDLVHQALERLPEVVTDQPA